MAVHKCSIIADPSGYGWEYAENIFEELKNRGKNKGFELKPNEVNVETFRDEEIKPRIKSNVRKRNCYFVHNPNLSPIEWSLQLDLINQALKKSSAQEIIDVFTYTMFSRQDRKEESRVPVSVRVIARNIEEYAHRAMTIDFHNQIALDCAYDIPFDNLSPYPTVVEHIKKTNPGILKNLAVMSPDVGGLRRARDFAGRIGVRELIVGDKYRKKAGEIESFRIIGDVERKNVFIVDDLVDSGNTLIRSCQEVKNRGAERVYAYATHGLFTEGIKKVTDNFDKFFIGDTRKLDKENISNLEIISFVPLFAEAIYRTSEGDSLSELFK